MTEGTNMICPSCGAFQPRAETCNKCGVIIAKASSPAPAASAPQRKAVAANTSKPPVAMIAVIAVVVIAIGGYFLFSGSNKEKPAAVATDTSQPKPAKKKSEIDRIGTYNPAIASNMHRTNVLTKISTLKTALHMYTIDGSPPPSDEEGLQLLVDKGLVSKSDITDEWGNVFHYRLEWGEETALEKKYKIYLSSNGPDGIAGNADDISP